MKIADLSDVADSVLKGAVGWYERKHQEMPEAFSGCNPLAVRAAYRLAGGEWHRMAVDDDGSIIVFNRAVW